MDKLHNIRKASEVAERQLRWAACAAVRAGETKQDVAVAAGITRPTLDAWISQNKPQISQAGAITYGSTHVGWLTAERVLTVAPWQDDTNRFGYAVAEDFPHVRISYSIAGEEGKQQLWVELDELLGLR